MEITDTNFDARCDVCLCEGYYEDMQESEASNFTVCLDCLSDMELDERLALEIY